VDELELTKLRNWADCVQTLIPMSRKGRLEVTSAMIHCSNEKVQLEVGDRNCHCDIRRDQTEVDLMTAAHHSDGNPDEERTVLVFGQRSCEEAMAA
jgi:hypothetical protein